MHNTSPRRITWNDMPNPFVSSSLTLFQLWTLQKLHIWYVHTSIVLFPTILILSQHVLVDHIGPLLIKWGNLQSLATYAVEGHHTFNIQTLKHQSTPKHGNANLCKQILNRKMWEMKLQCQPQP